MPVELSRRFFLMSFSFKLYQYNSMELASAKFPSLFSRKPGFWVFPLSKKFCKEYVGYGSYNSDIAPSYRKVQLMPKSTILSNKLLYFLFRLRHILAAKDQSSRTAKHREKCSSISSLRGAAMAEWLSCSTRTTKVRVRTSAPPVMEWPWISH